MGEVFGGVDVDTIYYIRSRPNGNSFTLSLTNGGVEISVLSDNSFIASGGVAVWSAYSTFIEATQSCSNTLVAASPSMIVVGDAVQIYGTSLGGNGLIANGVYYVLSKPTPLIHTHDDFERQLPHIVECRLRCDDHGQICSAKVRLRFDSKRHVVHMREFPGIFCQWLCCHRGSFLPNHCHHASCILRHSTSLVTSRPRPCHFSQQISGTGAIAALAGPPAGVAGVTSGSGSNVILTVTFSSAIATNTLLSFTVPGVTNPANAQDAQSAVAAAIADANLAAVSASNVVSGFFPAISGRVAVNSFTIADAYRVAGKVSAAATFVFTPSASGATFLAAQLPCFTPLHFSQHPACLRLRSVAVLPVLRPPQLPPLS